MKITKCSKCKQNDWKQIYPARKFVCAVCNPRNYGHPEAWPRKKKVWKLGRAYVVIIHDAENLKRNTKFTIHRESYGYKVVLEEK